MQIQELLQKLTDLKDKCTRENRKPTGDERKIADHYLAQIDAKEINFKLNNDGPDRAFVSWDGQHDIPQGGSTRDMNHETARGRTGQDISYRNLFGPVRDDSNGFDNFSSFLRSVASNRYDERLITRTQNISTPSDGGFLLQDSHASAIVDLALEKSLLWKNAVVFPMVSATLKVPAVSDTDHSTDRGGIVALWKSEEAELTLDSIKLRQLEFNARKLSLLIKSSREFLEDGIAAEAFIRNIMASEIAWKLDNNFLNTGSGAGMPLSILNSAATVEVAAEGGQDAGSLVWENVCNMAKSFNPAAGDASFWVVSPSLRSEIFQMNQASGTGGTAVFPDPSQIKERGLSLLGFPVHFSEHCSLAGQKGDIFLINPKAYSIGLRSDVRLEASAHAAFVTDQVVFKGTMRVDGMPIASAPMVLADGTSQVSDFVTLAAR